MMKVKNARWRQFKMDRISCVRMKLSPGTLLEQWLTAWYWELLAEQMEARRCAGVVEIECHVVWGDPADNPEPPCDPEYY